MAAAVYQGPGDLVVQRIPVPEPGPEQALVQVDHCGICGSDLHMVLDGWGRPGSTGGHEYSGVIVALGSEVSGWSVGDRVVGGPGATCGECDPCRSGRRSLCVARATPGTGPPSRGAFADYILVHHSELVAVPEGMPMRVAALTEPLAVAIHACTTGGVGPGQRVLVTGAGPIGLLVIAVLVAWGVDDITVSEPGRRRAELAAAVGATAVIGPDELVRPKMPMTLVDRPFDVALECSGRGAAQTAALTQLGRAGRLVLVGAGMDGGRFDANRIILNELIVTGSNEYADGDYRRALDLLASGRLPTALLIEDSAVGLDGLLGAMRGLAAGDLPGKVMVVPSMRES